MGLSVARMQSCVTRCANQTRLTGSEAMIAADHIPGNRLMGISVASSDAPTHAG